MDTLRQEAESYIASQVFQNSAHEVTAQNIRNSHAKNLDYTDAKVKTVADGLTETKAEVATIGLKVDGLPRLQNVNNVDLALCDESGNIIEEFADGHIKTKNFDSRNVAKKNDVYDKTTANSTFATKNESYTKSQIDESFETKENAIATYAKASETLKQNDNNNVNLAFADEQGNIPLQVNEGHIQTKNFDSSKATKVENASGANLAFADANGDVGLALIDGHIVSKNFDSRNISLTEPGNYNYQGKQISLKKTFKFDCKSLKSYGVGTGSRQGMDIYNGKIVLLQNTGICNIINLSNMTKEKAFNLRTYGTDNHANNFSFAKERAEGSDYPLMYITIGGVGKPTAWTCSVEKILNDNGNYSTTQVQTITLDKSEFRSKGYAEPWDVPSWQIDNERGCIWIVSALKRTTTAVTTNMDDNKIIAHRFRLPLVSEGNVVFTADDVLQECIFPFTAFATQGGTMQDGKIYFCFGFGGTGVDHSVICVYDTDTNAIYSTIDLKNQISQELEDLSIYNDELYVNTNSEYIYKLTF